MRGSEAHQQQLEQEQWENQHHECSVCSCDYTDDEGGIQGYIGILPASFCPTCLSGIIDMVQLLTSDEEPV